MNKLTWKIIKIFIITCILIYSITFIWFFNNLSHIKNNWNQYKCNPFYAPLAGFVYKKKGETLIEAGTSNMTRCLWVTSKSFFTALIKPFMYIISIITSLLKQIQGVLDKFRMQLIVIRKMLLSIVTEVMNRLQNLMAMFIFTFLKLRDTIKRIYATFKMMVYMLQTTALTFSSMINGPVGDMVKMSATFGYVMTYFLLGPISFNMFPSIWAPVLCFSPKFLVKIFNGKVKNIDKIRLNEKIYGGGTVIAIHRFLNLEQKEFILHNDIVSAEHLINYKDKWIHMKDHPDTIKINKSNMELRCISVDNNLIHGEIELYRDWEEISDQYFLKKCKDKILSLLNGNNKITILRCHLYQECFYFPDDSILNYNIELGHNLANNYILGKSLFYNNIIWYKPILSDVEQIFWVSGSVLVYHPIIKSWQPVYMDDRFIKLDNKKNIGYHFLTLTGHLNFNQFQFKDFIETRNPIYHNWYKNEVQKILTN